MTTLALATPDAEAHTLGQLAENIRREHELCVLHALSALEHAIRAGEALLKARELVPQGEWEKWVDGNCPAVARQARPYMRVAAYRDAIPGEIRTLTDGLRELRGLPAFDGSGPQRHPPEVRERAMRLVGEGLSQRMVASMLGINRKCLTRWTKGDNGRREGSYRVGRPTREEQKERRQQVTAEQRRAIGPAALANYFRAVYDAHRRGEGPVLTAALYDLSNAAVDWAEQLADRHSA